MVRVKYNKKMVDITASTIAHLIAGAVYPVIKVCDLYHGSTFKNYAYGKVNLDRKAKCKERGNES